MLMTTVSQVCPRNIVDSHAEFDRSLIVAYFPLINVAAVEVDGEPVWLKKWLDIGIIFKFTST